MATEITLCIEDDGTMYLKTGERQETPEQENQEGGKKVPVKSIDDALGMIKQMADAVTMPGEAQPDQEAAPDAEGAQAEGSDETAQEEAMMGSYRQGATGR